MSLSDEAIKFVKSHKNEIVSKFANKLKYPPVEKPFTIFMAGSPGAGKTEFSTSFDPKLYIKLFFMINIASFKKL